LNSSSARVSFTGAAGATSYTVIYSRDNLNYQEATNGSGTGSQSPIDVTDLTAGYSYTFKVIATNKGGGGPPLTSSQSVASASVIFV